MRIFISWSGERSKSAAQALRDWLPLVLHYAQPWMSATDIDAGQRWSNEVGQQLSETSFGVLCLTRDNLLAPWILFEAGALAKSLTAGAVVPYLIDGEYSDITGPLAQFQAKKADEASTLELLRALNSRAPHPIPADRLEDLFSMAWRRLGEQLAQIPRASTPAQPARKEREILEELVQVVRTVERRTRALELTPSTSTDTLPPWEVEARRQVSSGNKVSAIKLVREALGLGLKEAVDLVNSWGIRADWELQARNLMKEDREAEAIAIIRKHSQRNLREAKAFAKSLAGDA